MISVSNIKVGDMFRERRKNLGVSIVSLASQCDMAPSHISMMEKGQTLIKDGTKVSKLCTILCDDGTLLAYWSLASLRLEFFNESSLLMAIEHLKFVSNLGPMNMESDDE